MLVVWPGSALGATCTGNAIVCENQLPGTPESVWDIAGAGDPSIQGFATEASVDVGGTIDFKIDTDASAYSITIYRTGWYQGLGARKIADVTPSAALPQSQPQCITDTSTEIYDCGTWAVSASWTVPTTAVSGVYVATLQRGDTGGESQITFDVRDDSSHSDILFKTSDATWQAYNTYGGSDYYQGAANGRAYAISYNRPYSTRGDNEGRDFYFNNEYPLVRFLERNGYDVSYFSDVDADVRGPEILNHRVFLSVGHDEYWSGNERDNVQAAIDSGVNAQFLSGNEAYWHTRLANSVDGSNTPDRTIISYKETWSNAKIDPSPTWTGTWRDPRFASAANGGSDPENGLTGTMYMSTITDLPVTVTAQEGKLRIWRNTGLASMSSVSTALAAHTVGYESDEDVDNGFRPSGLIHLSTVSGQVTQEMLDFGSTVGPGTTTHNMTLYRAASGALVWGAGTVQWTWGLDQDHDGNGAAADPRMQQAQVNMLADMGVQPQTLMYGLAAATASTDTTPPTVTITSPTTGSTIANGCTVTVAGSASDVGGVVAGVEVSTDDGATWHLAAGTTSWSYTFVQHGAGTQSVQVRAVDDSANYAPTPTTVDYQVSGPYSVFGAALPKTADSQDASAAELGMAFTPSQDGFVTGVRFFKSAANTGQHTGSLWTSSGTRLASVTFTNESAAGWQQAQFTSSVAVSAGQTYVVSYSETAGHYSGDNWYWGYRGNTAGPVTVAGGFGSAAAGVYTTNLGTFPVDSYQDTDYYVDPVFSDVDPSPLTASGQWPLDGASSVPADTSISAQFSRAVTPASIAFSVKDQNGDAVTGTVAYDSTSRTATFTPDAPLQGFVDYSVTLTATATNGFTLSAGGSWSFTTVKPTPSEGVCPCSLFNDSTTPSILQVNDPNAVTLGVRFTPTHSGQVTGVKFYKGPANTGSHVGALWSSAGAQLASGTFAGESTSGWQTLTFAQPVQVSVGTQYVASYRTTVGAYSATPGDFSGSGFSFGPLSVGADAGAYNYADGFPQSASSTNYLVDVVFSKDPDPLSVVSETPANGALLMPTDTPISVSFSAALAAGYAVAVDDANGPIGGSTALSSDGTTLTFTSSSALPSDDTITVTASGLVSTAGQTLGPQTWTFTTQGPSATTSSLLGAQTPAVPAATDDASAVSLGVAFQTSTAGQVTAVRFYKGTGNDGVHTGALWAADGTELASATFSNETSSGWQTAYFSAPVSISPGVTYVASYYAPQGHYSYTSSYFTQPVTSGVLTAPATSNGTYLYGSAAGMPTYSWNATNYFVDVLVVAGSK